MRQAVKAAYAEKTGWQCYNSTIAVLGISGLILIRLILFIRPLRLPLLKRGLRRRLSDAKEEKSAFITGN